MPTTTHRIIPATAEVIPVLGLGTWQTFDVGAGAAARAPLADCIGELARHGGVVDSSPMYGRAEVVVGDLVAGAQARDRLFLATKVWTSGRQAAIDQMRQSVRKLRVERVDLMQVHNLVDARTHLTTLRDWKERGLVRYIGITHYAAHAHAEVARLLDTEPVDFVQINYSVAEREAESRVLPLAADRGVAVIANRPFGEGTLVRRLQRTPLPSWALERGVGTWAQLLLLFIVGHPAITCVIPATSNPVHLRENLAVASLPVPDESTRERIARAVRMS